MIERGIDLFNYPLPDFETVEQEAASISRARNFAVTEGANGSCKLREKVGNARHRIPVSIHAPAKGRLPIT